jgi:hypothetical protein
MAQFQTSKMDPSSIATYDDGASKSSVAVRDANADLFANVLRGSAGVRSGGHLYVGVVSKSATFTVDEAANNGTVYKVDATAGAVTVNLPAAAGVTGKKIVVIKTDASGNAVTLDGNAAETINGAATLALASQWSKATIISDGSNWLQIA